MKTIIAAALLAATATVAHAQDVGGDYKVSGTNHDGSKYSGTATITLVTDTTCEISWNTGSESQGICSRNGDAVAAAYVLDDAVGLVIYKVQPDGTLQGLWTIQGKEGTGTEVLMPE